MEWLQNFSMSPNVIEIEIMQTSFTYSKAEQEIYKQNIETSMYW